jgi:hypothetical protein
MNIGVWAGLIALLGVDPKPGSSCSSTWTCCPVIYEIWKWHSEVKRLKAGNGDW